MIAGAKRRQAQPVPTNTDSAATVSAGEGSDCGGRPTVRAQPGVFAVPAKRPRRPSKKLASHTGGDACECCCEGPGDSLSPSTHNGDAALKKFFRWLWWNSNAGQCRHRCHDSGGDGGDSDGGVDAGCRVGCGTASHAFVHPAVEVRWTETSGFGVFTKMTTSTSCHGAHGGGDEVDGGGGGRGGGDGHDAPLFVSSTPGGTRTTSTAGHIV